MSRVLTSRRVAAKAHRCDTCTGFIKSGSVYLRDTTPPRCDDGKWGGTSRECGQCATLGGRAGLLEIKEKTKGSRK